MKVLMAEPHPFHAMYRLSAHHLARGLARRGHQVTYISTCVSPLHAARLFGSTRLDTMSRLSNWFAGGAQESKNLYHYVPLTLIPATNLWPLDSSLVIENSLRFCLPPIGRFFAKRGPFDVVVVTEPRLWPLRRFLTMTPFIFRLADDMMEFDGMPKGAHKQIAMARISADLIITTSYNLERRLGQEGGSAPVVVIANGADVRHFAGKTTAPPDLTGIPRPRILYVGAIEEWFDPTIVKTIAEALPDVSIILIGRATIDLKPLLAYSNIHYLGPRPYDQVAAYCQASDVGIIPFKQNRLVDSVCPIKMFEYMAAGLPVVATSWRELRLFNSPVRLVEKKEGWPMEIRAALTAADDPSRYRAYAEQNSWEARVDSFESTLHTLCASKVS